MHSSIYLRIVELFILGLFLFERPLHVVVWNGDIQKGVWKSSSFITYHNSHGLGKYPVHTQKSDLDTTIWTQETFTTVQGKGWRSPAYFSSLTSKAIELRVADYDSGKNNIFVFNTRNVWNTKAAVRNVDKIYQPDCRYWNCCKVTTIEKW